MYANALRRYMQTLNDGEDIPSNELMRLYTPPAGGFIRREDTGETQYVNGQPGGIYDRPTDFTTPEDGGGPPPMQQPMRQPMQQAQPARGGQVMRVLGYGNGQVTELSPERGDVSIDYSRPMAEIPGVGKGYYSKDGRSAYVKTADGVPTKVLLGYDAEGSMRLNALDVARREKEAQIAHTQEQIDASRQARNTKEGIPGMGMPQSILEKQFGKAPDGKRWSEAGQLEDIPGGGGGKLNESQAKAAGMGTRAQAAHDILLDLEGQGVTTPGIMKQVARGVPVVGQLLEAGVNALPEKIGGPSVAQNKVEQAQRDFVNAVLRPESGASISESEFENARKQYFPQVGDPLEVIRQKQQAREREIGALGVMAGPGVQQIQKAREASQVSRADQARAVFDAQAAIRRGANPKAIRERLKMQYGLDLPEGWNAG